ncbi:MAG: hypothetical protein Q4A44_04970 [Bacteroidales bacterium]|nr:hypothetical protein [Bacteroidales bacterium]
MTKKTYSRPEILCVLSSVLMSEGPVTVISGVVDNVNDARSFDAEFSPASNTTFGEAPWE